MRRLSCSSSLKRALAFGVVALMLPAAAIAQTLPPASQVADQITVGWNLGNTLEAQCGETAWGNPAVTQQFINSVKAAGFNAVRIPGGWDCHANQTTLTIDPVWMARVKQVVDYAISQNMYVILNIHWDGGWLEDHPLFSFQTAVNQKQQAFWTQIANVFKNYDEHLLFAGTNEVHADYNPPTVEHITVQQSYNQTFVNAVRATGGNNASRTLVVQTYNTNIQHGLNFFTLPTDSASNRLMVEVHYYDPYDYTLNPNGPCLFWGAPYPPQGNCTWAYETYVDGLFAQVRTEWGAQGVPVIMGEYGVATRPSLDLASRQYYLDYINARAADNDIKTFYWDNGVSGTNGFALFNRNTGAVIDQGALDAIMHGAGVGNPNVNYTLTTSVNGSGTVSRNPTGTTYPGGTSVTLTATASAGFNFVGWTGDLGGAANPATIKMSANMTVTANFVAQGTGGSGTILREFWNNVTGTTIASLTSNASYPNSPTGSAQLTSLEGPINAGDNYGARIRGYVYPPISGAYTFWLACDDYGDLRLSTSADPAGAARIAFVEGWTNSREWSKYPSQRSAAINLTAGQKYYIEVLHKEATGGDNVAVSWQGPGIAQTVIGGSFLSPFVPQTGTTFALSVTKAGTGTGTITSAPAGINCGSTCSANYSSGTSVTLTAAAASGSTFGGWSGACTGTGTCTLSMTAVRAVTATFNTSGTGTTCANPITFTGNTNNFNTTGAVCYRTSATLNGWGCSNFDGRTVSVGGVARTCGQLPLTRSADGFTYFSVTAGTFPWASLFTW
jgi:endoglucanase